MNVIERLLNCDHAPVPRPRPTEVVRNAGGRVTSEAANDVAVISCPAEQVVAERPLFEVTGIRGTGCVCDVVAGLGATRRAPALLHATAPHVAGPVA